MKTEQRQEQLLTSYAAIRGDAGKLLGAVVLGTPLNDERMTRTSELTSGHTLLFAVASEKGMEVLADSNNASSDVVAAASSGAVTAAARAALSSSTVVHAEGEAADHVYGAVAVTGYAEQKAVLVAAVAPLSPAAERYRALRTRLAQSENGQARRVVLVTSPGKHDGKTVTVVGDMAKVYATIKAPATLDETLDLVGERYDLPLAAADFLYSSPYDSFADKEAKGGWVRRTTVDGRSCEEVSYSLKAVDFTVSMTSVLESFMLQCGHAEFGVEMRGRQGEGVRRRRASMRPRRIRRGDSRHSRSPTSADRRRTSEGQCRASIARRVHSISEKNRDVAQPP